MYGYPVVYIHKDHWRALVDINLGIGSLLTDYEAGSELLRMGDIPDQVRYKEMHIQC